MAEILGFSLSQEELLAALLIASIPLPMGFDDLETRIFNHLPEEVKSPLLAAAERSLAARGFLLIESDEVRLEEFVGTMLNTCSQPERSWIMIHQSASQEERASYFHQVNNRFLAHIEIAGIHQFLQIAGNQDMTETAIQLVAPLNNQKAVSMTGNLAEPTFAALANLSSRPTGPELRMQLKEAGLDTEMAQAFAETLDTLISISAFARFNHVPQSKLQRAFTIVRGKNAQWVLTLLSPGMLQVKSVNGKVLTSVLHDFGQSN